ncbi:MAG: hypothetical protein ACRDRH_05245 [Pseudonocardia sp.]
MALVLGATLGCCIGLALITGRLMRITAWAQNDVAHRHPLIFDTATMVIATAIRCNAEDHKRYCQAIQV